MWPESVPVAALKARRDRLAARLGGPALIVSGLARPRNYRANRYPFRAESHFLYFVGRPLEGAALLVRPEGSTLYAEPPDPEEALWTGAQPTLERLAEELGLDVQPLSELEIGEPTATLPSADADTAFFQSELVGRDIEPASGPELEGIDRALADAVIALRLQHDDAAVAQVRAAARVTDLAHRAGMRATRPGLREADVVAAMDAEIVRAGCAHAYLPIVTREGEVLHDERHHRVLEPNDLVLADVGAETPGGWASDVTRTWPVSGVYSGTQRALYEVVLAAQAAAIERVRPGVRYLDVHRAAGKKLLEGLIALGLFRGELEDLYARGAAALFFPHGIGHLLGLDVHDLEDLGDRAGYAPGRARSLGLGDRYLRLDRDLLPGMIVTIEPGYYRIPYLLDRPEEVGELEGALDRRVLEQFSDVRGIRIEDDVLVTKEGAEVLTASIPKAPRDVEQTMRG
ncbi:MAG TPA: aminopeptidase P family protein [Polyangiaceae bacterium]|nr:aminopeptidase P family protein [Polyangiaceae bacterium]